MSGYDEVQVSQWLRAGIAAAKAGRRDEARRLLMRVIEVNERSEQAWLWLSGVVDSDDDRLICLENVLTLAPDDAQARAGVRWLEEKGHAPLSRNVGAEGLEAIGVEDGIIQSGTEVAGESKEAVRSIFTNRATAMSTVTGGGAAAGSHSGYDPALQDRFLDPDGCVYCGLPLGSQPARCPHCGGRLTTARFKKKERSVVGSTLHAYWLLLAGLNVADAVVIGYVWENLGDLPGLIRDYMPYFVGPVIAGSTGWDSFVDLELAVEIVRGVLFALAVLGGLVALGVLLRRPIAHTLGLALIALHLVLGLVLFGSGFLGYLMVAFRAALTALVAVFMFNTVEDFAREQQRARLEPDRHLLNDADYYTRGRAYERRGMWAKALLHWRRAAAINPGRDTYFGAMARAYTHLGRYQQALTQVEQAIGVSRTPEEWYRLREAIVEARRQQEPIRDSASRLGEG
jgi:tetratricopeptide (TPR) repeat protein